ncbi:hypothetical protein [Gracilibacillus timonensis]|uniref:hypothetical protein n=1 Tax=Gracilibacillus timonensis TaxID=1816696 RepID=UPI000826B96C|nr:hypothetical protein [Gracilibacillus timonensis]
MGVYIYMNVLPNEIKQEDWEAVYEESLELVRAYPFLDDNVDWDSYEEPWQYGIYSDEVILDKNQLGWHIFGDYPTMMSAESFAIYRDIKNYRKITQYNYGNKDQENVKCRDILAVPLNKYVLSNELEIPIDNVYVFDGKTQRFPHHKYVLAIACLFECRFPEYVYVDGDISTEEKNNAINWANTILNKSIQLTEPLSNETLLRRIRSIVKDESAVLDAFMTLPVRRESYSVSDQYSSV